MRKINRKSVYWVLLFFSFSNAVFAKVEVVTPELTTQYNLNFKPVHPPPRYEMAVGSDGLIAKGFSVSVGALYLIDNTTLTAELISKTQSGNPAKISLAADFFPYDLLDSSFYDATDDFSKVVYVSANPNITSNDFNSDQDVFVYDRINNITERITGLKSHEGGIFAAVISPEGTNVAFSSEDWQFADTSRISGTWSTPGNHLVDKGALIYIYDVRQKTLTTPKINLDDNYKSHEEPLAMFLSKYADFVDAENLVFSIAPASLDPYGFGYFWHSYNLPNDKTEFLLETYSSSFRGQGGDNHLFFPLTPKILVFAGGYSPITGFFSTQQFFRRPLTAYDLSKQTRTNLFAERGLISKSGRYAVLFNNYRSNQTSGAIDLPGNIRVIDLKTSKIRKVLDIDKDVRKTYLHRDIYPRDYEPDEVICGYEYILNEAFYKQTEQAVPCNSTRDSYGRKQQTAKEFFDNSLGYYELSPSDFIFHNNDEYLTFEANQWYLGDSIPYNDFQYWRDQKDEDKRTTFVVRNPFLNANSGTDIRIVGKPDIDPQRDSGMYIWQQYNDGFSSDVFRAEFVAGDTQGEEFAGESIPFRGATKSYKHFVTPISIEEQFTDRLKTETTEGNTTTRFNLRVKKPFTDGLKITNRIDNSTCLMMFGYSGSLYLGPDKVEVKPPFNLGSTSNCSGRDIISVGEPQIDPKNDKGLFLWQPWPELWRGVYVSGDGRSQVNVNIDSAYNLNSFSTLSFEPTDSVTQESRRKITMKMNVSPPWQDGFRFRALELSGTCISTDSDVPIYIGPSRYSLKGSVNLDTLDNCAEYQ